MANQNNVQGFVSGLVLGGLVGGAVGILFAPQSGEETREYLSEQTDKVSDLSREKRGQLRKIISEEVKKVQEEPDKLKEVVEAAVEKFKEEHQSSSEGSEE